MLNGQQDGRVQVDHQINEQMEFKAYNELEPSSSRDTITEQRVPEPESRKQSVKINFKGKAG